MTYELLKRFKEVLSYDPETGYFVWKVRTHAHAGIILPGQIAGVVKEQAYILIGVDRKQYRANRLAWFFMTGEWPPRGHDVDHRDGDTFNNKWSNLRLLTRSRNNHNALPSVRNKSGVRGVSQLTRPGQKYDKWWLARIHVEKRIIHLGYFALFAEAVAARRAAEVTYLGEETRRK